LTYTVMCNLWKYRSNAFIFSSVCSSSFLNYSFASSSCFFILILL
jgi:hypothetical protein